MLILNPATVSSYLPYMNGLYRKYCCQKHGFLDFFFSGSSIDFEYARDPPHAHWTPPGPSKPTKPPKYRFFPWGGGGRPINALLTRVGIATNDVDLQPGTLF